MIYSQVFLDSLIPDLGHLIIILEEEAADLEALTEEILEALVVASAEEASVVEASTHEFLCGIINF